MLLFFITRKSFQNVFKQHFFSCGLSYKIPNVKSLLVSLCDVIMLLLFFLQLFVLSSSLFICKQVSILVELAGLNRLILVSQLFLLSSLFRLDAEKKTLN